MQEEQPLLDFGDYPRIDAAGLADFRFLPDGRLRLVMFDWYWERGVWQRRIAGVVTRTTALLMDDHQRLWTEYRHQEALH